MRVAIVENTEVTHHGQVGVALHEAAARIELYKPWRDGVLPGPGFDALVVFGGEPSALDDATHPYLPRLAALMAEAAAQGVAVLGVCLGAQVLARGLGAENLLGAAPEFGWQAVTLQPGAADDPVLGALPTEFPTFQWHSDTFTLPPGSVHLAGSGAARVQAFRAGRAGYGMQFHFEANRRVVADWARGFPNYFSGLKDELPEQSATLGAAADAHGLAIARAWVALV